MAIIRDIAEALVVALDGAAFSTAITVSESYEPEAKAEQLQSTSPVLVWVVYGGKRTERGSRTSATKTVKRDELRLSLVIAARADNEARRDALVDLLEELADFCLDSKVAGHEADLAENDPTFDFLELKDSDIFRSEIVLTYQAVRN